MNRQNPSGGGGIATSERHHHPIARKEWSQSVGGRVGQSFRISVDSSFKCHLNQSFRGKVEKEVGVAHDLILRWGRFISCVFNTPPGWI